MVTKVMSGFLFCVALQASAQVGMVTGKVLDAETRNPIEQVNVRYDRWRSLTSTDSTGNFIIEDRDTSQAIVFNHLLYRPYSVMPNDSIPAKILLHRCCEDRSQAQAMFTEYIRRKLRYPAKLRRMQTGGEVLIRF